MLKAGKAGALLLRTAEKALLLRIWAMLLQEDFCAV